ncbi:ABC transporter permease subunit [Cohnella soli]|uniref:ABC transporter permease subunit n=1 Tax=Cohnella soli TaxID=425005 RepID=A0ABW0HZ90_9BACL
MRKAIIGLLICWSVLLPAGSALSSALGSAPWTLDDKADITSLSVSEDGSLVAAGTQNAQSVVFDAEGRQKFAAPAGNVVTAVSLLQDGRLLAASDDYHVYMYDAQGTRIWDANLKKRAKSLAASSDGSVIAAIAKGDTGVRLLDAGSGNVTSRIDVGFQTNVVAVSSNGKWIAAGGTDQYVYLIGSSGKVERKIALDGIIESIGVTDDGSTIVGVSNRKVHLFTAGGEPIGLYRTKDDVTGVAAAPQGKRFAAADYSGNYYVLSDSAKLLWNAKPDGIGRRAAFSTDGRYLVTASGDGVLRKMELSEIVSAAGRADALRLTAAIAGSALVLLILAVCLYMMKKRNKLGLFRDIWRERGSYLMILPTFALLIVFLYYPAFSGLFHSFYDWIPGGRTSFIGWDNYERAARDPYVVKGIGNLLALIVTGIAKSIVPPLIVAEFIYHLRSKRSQYWFRTGFVASMVIPAIAATLIWKNLYDPNLGLINNLLEGIGLGNWAHPWLGDPKTALWAIIFIGFPFVGILPLLVLYAGLISIPYELIEAAKIDGARTMHIVRSVHLPLIRGQIKLLLVLFFIATIQEFGSIMLLTGGGPLDSTYVPALQMYFAATNFHALGYASALGVLMFLIIIAITILNMKFFKTDAEG